MLHMKLKVLCKIRLDFNCVLFQNSDCIQHEIMELSKLPAAVKVQRMLSAFKQYKRRVFKPDAGVSLTDDSVQSSVLLKSHINASCKQSIML